MSLNQLAQYVHKANELWWADPVTGEKIERNKGELLMLIVSEISETLEGERRDIADTHLPHRRMAEVELADALIRILDYAGAFGYDLDGAFTEKMVYNERRADHKHNVRLATGGKKF
jgi:NTP pyrophosphatase (non-canonical NTP hydrolase)